MRSEGYSSCRVRVSVKSHSISGAYVCRENAATYSADDEGQTICGVFSETAQFPRSSALSLGWPYRRPGFKCVANRLRLRDCVFNHCVCLARPRSHPRLRVHVCYKASASQCATAQQHALIASRSSRL